MAWIPLFDQQEPYVFDDQTGERVATCHKYQQMHEPPLHAWSRACVMSMAPELHGALADLLTHARRHFPSDLEKELKEADAILDKVRRLYEQRRTN